MLKIKNHQPEELGLTGKDLLKVMQNKSTPILDLFVRESLQNSLDAQDPSNPYKFVLVDYITGNFNGEHFCSHLENIDTIERNRNLDNSFSYLAIRDTNTVGLTGPLSADLVKNNDYGNLQKLIYQLFKNQTQAGAGGSYGVGKTTFFSIGIGVVVFYSRIRLDYNNYQSRLVVCIVEDPQSSNKILRQESNNPTGVAWWGNLTENGYSSPLIDDEEIGDIVNGIFGIPLYQGTQTGTTVIIPYIDEKRLLENNRTNYFLRDDNEESNETPLVLEKPWEGNLADFIKVSVQRWYAPRLANSYYYNYWKSKFLKVRINNQYLNASNMDIVFQLIRELYNVAIGYEQNNFECEINNETILIRKQLIETDSGKLVFAYVPREQLGLKESDRLTPAVWFNCKSEKWESNCPFVAYTRKPGMIVTYSDDSWVKDLPYSDGSNFMVGLFVLNSTNILRHDNTQSTDDYTLEAYARECEKSDHMMWEDIQFLDVNKPTIIAKIQMGVIKKLAAFYQNLEDDEQQEKNIDYNPASTLLGSLFMPPEGFGTEPTSSNQSNPGSSKGKTRNIKYSYRIIYEDNLCYLIVQISTLRNKQIDSLELSLLTESSSSPITANIWEKETGLKIPIEIIDSKILENESINPAVTRLKTDNGLCYGIRLSFSPCAVNMEIKLGLRINRKDVKPQLKVE